MADKYGKSEEEQWRVQTDDGELKVKEERDIYRPFAIIEIDQFLSEQECEGIIHERANHITNYSDDTSVRKCKIRGITSNDVQYDWLMKRIVEEITAVNEKYYGFALDQPCPFTYITPLSDKIKKLQVLSCLSYEVGDYCHEHTDLNRGYMMFRKVSFVLQLSKPTDYDGGELIFNVGATVNVGKGQGTLIVFPSYVLHHVTPILSGTRHVLIGFAKGPKFV